MRGRLLAAILGSFLKVFAVLLTMPIAVGLYYGETFWMLSGFFYSLAAAVICAIVLSRQGNYKEPSATEAITATVLGWFLAIVLGSIPFLVELSLVNSVFESAAGFTTTGMSMVLNPGELSESMLIWRALIQWIGGLGVLTFFIAVIRESGGVSRKLFSAETHKTDPGSIRPSLKKSILELWKVYAIITGVMISVYAGLGMPVFEAVAHSFSAISTGGFSATNGGMADFSQSIQAVTTVFMFIGGVNFVLLYKALNLDKTIFQNSELKLYSKIFLIFSGLILFDLGLSTGNLLDAVFQSATVVSSTGYSTTSFLGFSLGMQFLLIGLMFVGGSLGSTSGGFKTFRLKALIEMTLTKIKSYSLPSTAINEVKIDGEILEHQTLRTISVLLFAWIAVIFTGTGAIIFIEDAALMEALSGTVSAAGNMGPVFMPGEEMVGLSVYSKMVWVFVMVAGRLEMLPLLAIFNNRLFSK